MKLAAAEKLAEKVVAELEPFCMRIAVAGSIRRQRAEVNDIDLVLIPKPELDSMRSIVARCEKSCSLIQGDPYREPTNRESLVMNTQPATEKQKMSTS